MMPHFSLFLKVLYPIARIVPLFIPPIDCFLPKSFGMIYFLEVPKQSQAQLQKLIQRWKALPAGSDP